MMFNKNRLVIEEIKADCDSYLNQIEENKYKMVMCYENGKFVESYDKEYEKRLQHRVNELSYLKEKLRIEGSLIRIIDKKMEQTWSKYRESLVSQINDEKKERTEKIFNSTTKSVEYVANKNFIMRLHYEMEEIENEHLEWIEENNLSLRNIMLDFSKLWITKVVLALFTMILVYVFFPFGVNKLMSTKSPAFINVAHDNDWIGFWGTYIAGTFGAIIGGYIAYKIASSQFEKQIDKEKEDRIIELKTKKYETVLIHINKISADIDTCYITIKELVDIESEDLKKLTYELLDKALKILNDKVTSIFNALEEIGVFINSNRVVFHVVIGYFSCIQGESIKLCKQFQAHRDYYQTVLDYIDKQNVSGASIGEIKKLLETTNKRRKNLKYELYYFDSKLHKDIFKILYPEKVFRTNSHDEFMKKLS